MNFCSHCGKPVVQVHPENAPGIRHVCAGCGVTFYHNPCVVVAVYVCSDDQILWIRRGIEPSKNLWALPGGFMEGNESPEQAVCRELYEETHLTLRPDQLTLVSVSSILHMAQTHLVFRCHVETIAQGQVTEEALELQWFDKATLPWQSLAFESVKPQIHQMYEWLDERRYGIRVGLVDHERNEYRTYPLADTDQPSGQW